MDCPHLYDGVKLNRVFIKNKKCELSTAADGTNLSEKVWKCFGKQNFPLFSVVHLPPWIIALKRLRFVFNSFLFVE